MRRFDLGTFSFLQPGWWIAHIVAIIGLILLGKELGEN